MENYRNINIFDILKNEIEMSLKHKQYLSALICALTIPDIFGLIAYPNLCQSVSKRYSKWFDEHVYNFMGLRYSDPFYENREIKMNGAVCYQLRCKLLHEGKDHVREKTGIDEFVLVFNDEPFVQGRYAGNELIYDKMEVGVAPQYIKYLYVSVVELCTGIINAAEQYRNDHNIEDQLTKLKINHGGGKINKSMFSRFL